MNCNEETQIPLIAPRDLDLSGDDDQRFSGITTSLKDMMKQKEVN